MKINQLIRDLEAAREFLGEDAQVFVGEPNTVLHGTFEVVANPSDEFGPANVVIQSLIVKGRSK
jgi:hypothetical protein